MLRFIHFVMNRKLVWCQGSKGQVPHERVIEVSRWHSMAQARRPERLET